MVLAAAVLRVGAGSDRRRIYETADGLRLYMDPLSHPGRTILESGSYEGDTEERLRNVLRPGDVFVDVGANEGVLSALASRCVGADGFVLAVEPQSRLLDLVEINIRLNGPTRFAVIGAALGGEDGSVGEISLYPSLNSGASSFVARYRFSRLTEAANFVSLERLLDVNELKRADLVKIDVEGYEGRVVDSMLGLIRSGRIRRILIDYHDPFLASIGDSRLAYPQRISRCRHDDER